MPSSTASRPPTASPSKEPKTARRGAHRPAHARAGSALRALFTRSRPVSTGAGSRRRMIVSPRSRRSSRRYSARRLKPSIRAAAFLLPCARSSARWMCSRSTLTSSSSRRRRLGQWPARRSPHAHAAIRRRRHAHRQLALPDEIAVRQDARALDHVAQLAHVAVPGAAAEQAFRARRQPGQRFLQPLRRLAHERGGQIRNVFAPIAQRRQFTSTMLRR